MNYVFWPKHLSTSRHGIGTVVAIRKAGSDWVVLAVLEEKEYNHVSSQDGYVKIGTWDPTAGFQTALNDAQLCFMEFVPPKLKLMQFYSLEPIPLILPERDYLMDSPVSKQKKLGLEQRQASEFRLRKSISVLNLYHEHLLLLEARISRSKSKPRRTFFTSLYQRVRKSNLWALLCHWAVYLAICVHFLAITITTLLNGTPLNLVSQSATAQQIDLRCQQLCYFPVQYLRINEIPASNKTHPRSECQETQKENDNHISPRTSFPCENYPDYIRFYNTIWLIVNDVSFGLTVGTLLAENSHNISEYLNVFFTRYLFEKVHQVSTLLGQNPIGIKLNGELACFLSDLFLWIIDFSYSTYIRGIISTSSIGFFLKVISTTSCCFGLTFALSLIVDLMSLLTMHISLFYFISAKMYHWQLHVMRTLLYLFYGKKRNVLRNRVDSNHFELDQLLMGTLFFTILIFLLPTLSLFYASFTVFRMAVLMPEVALESIMALLNHFPLFVLLLKLKDPKRIPGGITVKPIKDSANSFNLQNNPLMFKTIFRPYAVLMRMMVDNYFSLSTLNQVLVGRPLTIKRNKMYKVLYSALPKTPITTRAVWTALSGALG
ncbi:LANO_0F15940g1_1 [Lachancea nothofagi CBS 11611]|uniref:LANO_0F15940g1_1 n=1 Tax=Lachancea nothofagi CBS 11611 TaxID=1266666 RepID=A0A1G4KCP8_9SACH|nr:LANO_0F15940g1_1 [Lachancea nothofagi CBS 11611]